MSRLKSQVVYNDLTGGLNNVNSIDTINYSTKRTESPDLCNVEFFKIGGIKTMEGNIQFGNKLSSRVVGGWEYTKGNNKYMIIALDNGEIYRYNDATDKFDGNAIDAENNINYFYKFPTSSDRVSFCDMNNGVVITNGKDDPVFFEVGRHVALTGTISTTANSKTVSGVGTKFTTEIGKGDYIEIGGVVYIVDTITNDTSLKLKTNAVSTLSNILYYLSTISQCNAVLTNTDPEVLDFQQKNIRGLAIQFYAGRLWIGGKEGLFYSQLGQYNKWDEYYDAGLIAEVYNDTSEIKALGLYSDYMLIHKEFNTYLLTMTGDRTTIAVKPYSNISCDSQQSWIVSNTKYYVYSREYMDIYPLTQRTVFSDKFIGEPLTVKVRDVFKNIREADADKIFCVSYPKKRWMVFYMPMVDQEGSAYGLIYDFQCKAFLVRKVPQFVTCAFNFVNNVYIGTDDGLILKEFTGINFNGDKITAYYKTPWLDWLSNYTQSFAEFSINLSEEYNNNFYIRTFKDGLDNHEDRLINNDLISSDGLVWDGYSPDVTNYYIFNSTIDGDTVTRFYIPKLDADDTTDTVYTIPQSSDIRLYKDGDDLKIYLYNTVTKEEELYTTISDYYLQENIDYEGQDLDDNITLWDDDSWVSGGFSGIRMLLPNNVFEKFQIEFGTDTLGQGFAIYGYDFRRIETEEAPWG